MRVGDVLDASHQRQHLQSCVMCADRVQGMSAIDPLPDQKGRVYLTSYREYGRYYASLSHYGDLYQVEPLGELVVSLEDRFETWTAQAARIVAVYARAVRLTDGQRAALMKRWIAADAHADGWAGKLEAMSVADRRALLDETMRQLWAQGREIARESACRARSGST